MVLGVVLLLRRPCGGHWEQVHLFDQPGMTDLSAHVHFPSLAVRSCWRVCVLYVAPQYTLCDACAQRLLSAYAHFSLLAVSARRVLRVVRPHCRASACALLCAVLRAVMRCCAP